MQKPATTAQPIDELLSQRWSPRAFKQDRKVTDAEMVALAEAARWTPSCFGAEPWSFVFCPRHDQAAWDKALACLLAPNQVWAGQASLLVAAIAQQDFAHDGTPNRHHLYDTGAAVLSLVLQAERLGLRAHQMGGFEPAAVVRSFSVPEGWDCIAMIAVGEQGNPSSMPAGDARDRETAPRSRQPLGSKFFLGGWGNDLG